MDLLLITCLYSALDETFQISKLYKSEPFSLLWKEILNFLSEVQNLWQSLLCSLDPIVVSGIKENHLQSGINKENQRKPDRDVFTTNSFEGVYKLIQKKKRGVGEWRKMSNSESQILMKQSTSASAFPWCDVGSSIKAFR